ncbi:MAG: DUF4197 domain-containing protein [Pseudomonadota bacterium]
MTEHFGWNRRKILIGASALGLIGLLPAQASAQGIGKGLGLSSLLGKATNSALDQLSQPGAFYNDKDIRIGLPIIGKAGGGILGSILSAGQKLGVLDGVTRKINDAAGIAAGEAKPIFRDAIDNLSFNDAPGIISENDGGTRYLRESSNDTLHGKLEPLVDSALDDLGVYGEFESLSSKHSFISDAGLNRQSINKSVTDQGLDGIFSYIANEERTFRKNPLGNLGGALGDLLGN